MSIISIWDSRMIFLAVIFAIIQISKGQSGGFFFSQQDPRYVSGVQSNQASGQFFPSGFGNQFRQSQAQPTQDFSQHQVFNRQGNFDRNNIRPQFQTGRSQPAGNYFITQSDFQSRPNQFPSRGLSPTSFQVNHPASTNRPDFSHFAQQSSHNHDPSKPEVFLGQITINNPDPFPNNPEDDQHFNSPRIRPPGVVRSPSLDFDANFPSAAEPVNQDIFEYSDNVKATTYNPRNKALNRIVHNPSRPNFITTAKDDLDSLRNKPISTSNENFFSSGESFSSDHNRFVPRVPVTTTTVSPKIIKPTKISAKPVNKPTVNSYRSNKPFNALTKPTTQSSTTEYKPLFDLAPLLEDEIPDHRYGSKHLTNGSEDVQVIKSSDKPVVYEDDLKTSEVEKATKTTASKVSNDKSKNKKNSSDSEHSENVHNLNITTYTTEEYQPEDDLTINNHNDEHLNTDDTEYYDEIIEYVDEVVPHDEKTKPVKEDYDEEIEYEEVEEDPQEKKEEITTVKDSTFEILTMKPKQMVKDDNFKEFVDSGLIDNTEPPAHIEYVAPQTEKVDEEITTLLPSILGEEVVSVVTTKSVVNGTYSVLNNSKSSTPMMNGGVESTTVATDTTSNSTESWVVVASVQTSRSVSGARFLPFPGVAQEEKKQTLAELDETEKKTNDEEKEFEDEETVEEDETTETNTKSTESIIDKLDRVQSELSSGLLSGGFKGSDKDIDVITEMSYDNFTQTEATTIPAPLQIFTVKSTSTTPTTERSAPEPLPVMIKKFSPYSRPTTPTTVKPKAKLPVFETIVMDDVSGLLPPGFKIRPSFKDRKITTSTTTTTDAPATEIKTASENQGRSSGLSFKNRIAVKDDVSSFLPKGYKPPKDEKGATVDDVIKSIKSIDVSHLLPPGYKLDSNTEAPGKTPSTKSKPEPVSIAALLPKGYKLYTTTTEAPKTSPKGLSKLFDNVQPVDVSSFLPPGFKLPTNNITKESSKAPLPESIKVGDISAFLPPGFKLETEGSKSTTAVKVEATTKAPASTASSGGSGPFKVVFPFRPGAGKPGKRLTTPKPDNVGSGGGGGMPMGGVSVPSIQKGWPTRQTTEFTGWPTPSTTPFSIEKLLEAQRAAMAKSSNDGSSDDSVTTERTTTTSTTPSTTTTTMQPTTPGVCYSNCDLAATIKIVEGVKWVPELLDHNTKEWQLLANEISRELDGVYSKSTALKKWYKGIRIDAFSEGSVLVDYFVELNDISDKVDTSELKKLFHKSLSDAKPGSVLVDDDTLQENQPDKLTGRKIDGSSVLDEDMMLGDQPPEERESRKKDVSKGKLEIGKFIVDPIFTEFIVLPKRTVPTIGFAEDNNLLPQWGIAVIVIALASLLFVVIFGVTVIVNRQKNAKAKQPIPLSEDMLRELDKSHMGGDLYLQEHEPPYHKVRSQKRNSTTVLDPLDPYPGNPGDSWRSEWGPYYSQFSQSLQHQQHYAPDSGRGSGNYGYSGSQIYGYNGGGSTNYGYAGGDGARTMYPRRRSDFDSNF